AQLLAQNSRCHLFNRAFWQVGELECPERNPDQPVHLEAERAQYVANLAILPFANGKREPDIGALYPIERRLYRPVMNAADALPLRTARGGRSRSIRRAGDACELAGRGRGPASDRPAATRFPAARAHAQARRRS